MTHDTIIILLPQLITGDAIKNILSTKYINPSTIHPRSWLFPEVALLTHGYLGGSVGIAEIKLLKIISYLPKILGLIRILK